MTNAVSTLEKKDDGTIVLSISIPQDAVKKARTEVMEKTIESANLPGFRKGKAPKKLVEDSVNEPKIQEEILKNILPQAYIEAVTEHKLKPIVNPRINVEKVTEGEPWVFTAETCEMPEVDLGDYKARVQKVTAKSKIVIPGKESEAPKFDDIMNALLEGTKITIPHMLIDHEVDRLLAHMLDEVKKLGLTLDQYLASTGKSPEVLRDEYHQKAEGDIKLEFSLQKIADVEKIIVEPKELDEAILKATSPQEKQQLEANRYVLANILKQQKTLDFLRNL